MKASELLKEGSELHHKLRGISDLIRHIETRETDSEASNYNVFLGAGCSVTSGIRPAGKLIELWMIELYQRFKSEKPASIDDARKYFEQHHSSWYNRDSAYSSLFEKVYEFAPQRRRFVEKEVDNKLPSIGYAYLSSLVSKKYFNTIFTTNFDDLINESLYQFTNDRPLVCAHDSSVKSISITSKRPKIIKLHGDYLYDDIKSTVRETESLEQNIKDKLIDYCKEFGMIMVGYSGNDRSIMDVLDFLTKQDDYLKNGIYWCLRKDDEVNHILQNMLWKEKVYPVIIDGFDELFAEIHTNLTGGGIDFEANLKNSKLQQIKKKILDETNPINQNKYIRQDIKNIKEINNKQEISDLFTSLSQGDDTGKISLNVLRNLLEVEDLIKKDDLITAYKIAEEYFYNSDDVNEKLKYVSMLISVSDEQGDYSKCLKWCEKLIELDPNKISNFIKKSTYIDDLVGQYRYLRHKSTEFECSYPLYNALVKTGLCLLRNDPETSVVDLDSLIEFSDKSLKLNPSLSNSAWLDKYDLLKQKRKNIKSVDVDLYDDMQSSIKSYIKSACDINKNHLVCYRLKISEASYGDDFNASKVIVDDLYELYKKSDISNKVLVNECIDDLMSSFLDYKSKVQSLRYEEEFYEKHLKDKDIEDNSELLLSKCRYFIARGNRLDKAITYYNSAISSPDVVSNFRLALSLNYVFSSKNTDRLIDILKSNKSAIYKRYYFEYMHELLIDKCDYVHALEYLEKAYESGISIDKYFSAYSYLMLVSSDYQKLIDFENAHGYKLGDLRCEAFVINVQYARKKLGLKIDDVALRNIISRAAEPTYKIACFAILGQDKDMERLVSEQIDVSYLNFYLFKRWPIISPGFLDKYEIDVAA